MWISLGILLGLLVILRIAVPLVSGQPAHVKHASPDLSAHTSNPNFVSSLAPAGDRHVEPLGPADQFDAVVAVIAALPRTREVFTSDGYAHFVCTTALWGFRDDVQVQVQDGMVQVKSSSRLGLSDLDTNRRRVEAIRAKLPAATNNGD